MPNQLTLPSKSTPSIPLRSALQEYVQSPEAFRWDIKQWETMRREAVTSTVHIDATKKYAAYHAQLVFIGTKLPVDINLSIPYTRAFLPNSPPFALSNLAYERVNILFNLAALYCQLATSEDRASGDGIKRAVAHFQHAAGVLSHLITSALPPLEASLPPNTTLPADMARPFFKALQWLMLAQAQECFWQRAIIDGMKNILIARLSSKTASLYKEALYGMEFDSSTASIFPREWIPHVRTKYHHFAAAALYRKSVDDLEANRYGDELARLGMAKAEAKKALDAARQSGIARAVQDDIQSLYKTLEACFTRAERDNDLIYHQVVPAPSSVPPIQETKDMVMSIVPKDIKDPKSMVKDGEAIFGGLSGWGVKVAVEIYKEKKNDWIQNEIFDRAKSLDSSSTAKLEEYNLPAALDALDRPVSLPPSLLGKAEEVRLEDGMHRIPALLEDIERLARRDATALDEALDILDQEAMEDEEMREAYSVDVWTRPASHEANQELTDQARRYREVLDRAMKSDGLVRDRWEEWAEHINVLCWDEMDIERAVPSSTVSSTGAGGSNATQAHARALRSHLESLDDILAARAQLVQRVQRVSDGDDIAPRLMREAEAVARWVEVRPEMFDDALEEELGKYERFRGELEDGARRQEEALRGIAERNVLFLDSRRDDPSVKARERGLQNLDLAYHKYREIHKSLTDAIKFYNDFASVLGQFKESCKAWVIHRRKDVEWLLESLNSMHLSQPSSQDGKSGDAPDFAQPVGYEEPAQPQPVKEQPVAAAPDDYALDLPPPDSADWEAIDVSAARPPPPQPRRTTRASRRPAF